MSETSDIAPDFLDLTADIVSAFVSNNSIRSADLPELIANVHGALFALNRPTAELIKEAVKPAVPARKSVTPEFIICLEDGLKFKSLKRHLRAKYQMSPDEYRAKWGLPDDYPMVAPLYASQRSDLAKRMGLGQQRRIAAEEAQRLAAKSRAEKAEAA